jgi:hypothetical protein
MEETANTQENSGLIRDENGKFVKGTGPGPGRPKGKTMKEYMAEKFRTMSDEEKELWLKEHKIYGIDKWKMAEGNPQANLELGATDDLKEFLLKINNVLDN